jgi:hypothetical protein
MKAYVPNGADELRTAVRVLDNMREGFNSRFTPLQLLRLVDPKHREVWDYTPDQWADFQVTDLLERNIDPKWDDDGVPVDPDEVDSEATVHS